MMLVRLSALSGLAALAASSATAAPPFNASLPVTRVNHQAPPVIPFPIGPAKTLPNLDGTGYPPYRIVFEHGECSANDAGGAGDHPINMNKTCFSCFRIPTLLGGQSPGVIHAFAEARRGDLTGMFHQYTGSGMSSCPDCPDTRLAYKRSTTGGASWSPIKIFLQHNGDQKYRAENGHCQSQAAPFIDPDTKTLFVAFNQDGPGCVGSFASSRPMLVNSTDDGITWSDPYSPMLNIGPGLPPVAAGAHGYAVGPTKGLTVKLPDGGTRLMIPGENAWSASVYSDDHGKTWSSNAGNRSLTLSPGEMDWTPCVTGTACPGGAKYVMINRAGGKVNPQAVGVSYSHDSITWSKEAQADNGDLVAGHGHAKPGIVAVAPGVFISSQTLEPFRCWRWQIIALCKKGLTVNTDMTCGTAGSANYTTRKPSDVLNYGMALLISKDGTNWTLFKKTWPIQGMYTTAAALTVNTEGAALTYGIIFAGGSLPTSKTGTIFFMNFTAVHLNGTVDGELADAIARLKTDDDNAAAASAAEATATATAPPFTYNIDQSVPCPSGSADYSVAAPLADPSAALLQGALAPVPAMLTAKLKELGAPATMVIITQGGKTIFESYQGSAKAHSQAALSSSSGVLIASITKTFTSTMLFKLRDEGKLGPLGLDTPVTHLMQEFGINSPYPSGRGITLRALAMHVSGLPREHPEGATEAEILSKSKNLTVLSPQFEQAHYSNFGIALLGRALQRVVNVTWEEYVDTELLAPLGMKDSGLPPWKPEVLARMAEGVSSEGKLVALSNRTSWGSPCGSIHSSPRDMATWMNFHMDVGTPTDKAMYAKVLDPATRAEMKSTGFLLGDGLGGVSSAVFETAYIHGRRTMNKLGNDPGYRSSMTMVPDLALGIFATATSSGDLWGDGDAVGFPVASRVIPVVDELLVAQDLTSLKLPNASFLASIVGVYCTSNISAPNARALKVERIPVPSSSLHGQVQTVEALVMRHAGYPSMVMRYEGGNVFRQTMGPELSMPIELPPCHNSEVPGQNLCPTSCNRRLFRGSGSLYDFKVDERAGVYHGKMGYGVPGSPLFECHRYPTNE